MDVSSSEQLSIRESIISGYNVIVNATPGSGKTSTCVMLITTLPYNILVLTFSRSLYIDGREKLKRNGFENKIYSFYSLDGFSYRYYNGRLAGDIDFSTKIRSFNYDVIIVDECQDIGEKHYKFIKKVLQDNINPAPVIVLMGDIKQCIFSDMDSVASDSRYLSMGELIFPSKRPWIFRNLSQTFRMTKQICQFVNNTLLNNLYINIKSNKDLSITKGDSPQSITSIFNNNTYKPRYLFFNSHNCIVNEINYYLSLGYSIDDILILSPSVKKSYIIQNLVNVLAFSHNIYLQSSDDNLRYEHRYGTNKLKVLTFHTSKGLESKVVIVLHFDISLSRFYKNIDLQECPNLLYVAVTRASERLTVCHSNGENFLPFINTSNILTDTQIIGKIDHINESKMETRNEDFVTEFTKYINEVHLKEAVSKFKIIQILPPGEIISLIDDISNGNIVEAVSDINGTAITSFYEYTCTGNMKIFKVCKDLYKDHHKKYVEDQSLFDTLQNDYPFVDKTNMIKELLFLTVYYNALTTKVFHRLKQIKRFDWIDEECLLKLVNRLQKINIKGNSLEDRFEKGIQTLLEFDSGKKTLVGRVDYMDNKRIIEIKCKNELAYEDFIQLMIYKYIEERDLETSQYVLDFDIDSINVLQKELKPRSCFLYNIKNGLMYKVDCDIYTIRDIMIQLNTYKNNTTILSDEEFINKCLSIKIQ